MRLPLIGLSGLVLAMPGVAQAEDVWMVGPTRPLQSISAALVAAQAEATPDVILVEAGTFTECLTITGSVPVRIVALEGSADTTISCAAGVPYAVEVGSSAIVALSGFTIVKQDGLGGVRSSNATSLLLSDVTMEGMIGTTGAGCVDATGGTTQLFDVHLSRCFGTNGGAVRVSGTGAKLGIVGGTISTADASLDGGAVHFTGFSMWASGVTISAGTAANGKGGALYIAPNDASQVTRLTAVTVETSLALAGGGLYTKGAVEVVDSKIEGNTATGGDGGGMYGEGSLTMLRGNVTDNIASGNGGGVITLGVPTFKGTRIEGNQANLGGGVYCASGVNTMGVVVRDNHANLDGGGLYAASWGSRDDVFVENDTGTIGGGAFITGSADIRGTRFTDNTSASSGAGLRTGGGTTITRGRFVHNVASAGTGGAINFGTGGSPAITFSAFEQNEAPSGGAIGFPSLVTGSKIADCTFEDNKATAGSGGAIFQSLSKALSTNFIDASRTFFRNNTATSNGGAISADRTAIRGTTNWFTHNDADGSGGAIYTNNPNDIRHIGSLFCQNHADGDGGAIFTALAPGVTSGASGNYEYTTFQENSAGDFGGAYYESTRLNSLLNTGFFTTTIVGNTSGLDFGTADAHRQYGGLGGSTTARLTVQFSVIQGNGTAASPGTGIHIDNAALSSSTLGELDFSGPNQTTTYNAPGASASGIYTSGGTPNPISLTTWIPGANCFDDDLTGLWTNAGTTNGVSWDQKYYRDLDGDGVTSMERDCDTSSGSIFPGQTEFPGNGVDDDCDFGDDPDADADGWASDAWFGADCNDNNDQINPDVFDVGNDSIDNDCTFGPDIDADGDNEIIDTDCDDADPLRNTLVPEIPYEVPAVDQNCNPFDEYDADDDGDDAIAFGGGDCNDLDPDFGSDAVETPYDGIDQNCDGFSDFDADVDGVVSNAFGGTDCNDFDPLVWPGAPEVPYDNVQQDCGTQNDFDWDLDGFVATAYNAFAGGSATGLSDCDDTNPDTFPGAPEITDGLDNTCDGVFNPDPDFDGDGVLDWWENVAGTGVNVTDSDGDGLSDGVEWGLDEQNPDDADGDDIPDALEIDADNDSLPDAFEGLADHDGDLLEDYRDTDDDNDGILSEIETDSKGADGAPDTDKDGTPDWLDLDSDADGALDLTEGTADPDGDTIGAWRDNGSTGTGSDVTPPPPEHYGFGCGCQSVPNPSLSPGWILGLGFLALRRKRQS